MKMKRSIIITIMLLFGIVIPVSFGADDFGYSKLSETLLNQDPDPAEPGEYVEIRFKVEKEGNDKLDDIVYELVPEYPFSFDDSDVAIKTIGNWEGSSEDDEFYTLYYKLLVDENAIEDTYELTLRQTSTSNDLDREIEFDIRVGEPQSPSLLVGDVSTAPAKLIADYDEATINIELVNNGEEDAKQVIAELVLPDGFEESFGYSNVKNLGTIAAGNSLSASFYFDTNEELLKGNYDTKIRLTYKEDTPNAQDEVKTIELPFTIDVFGRPSYEIEVVEVDDLKPSTSENKFKISVKNIGSLESDSTSVQVFKDSSQPFDFEDKSDFIGKLDVGETSESVFVFDIDEDAEAKEYRLKLQIRSVVEGDVLVEDEVVVLNIDSTKKPAVGENPFIRYSFYVVFLGIGIVIGRRMKNSSKKKK